MKVKVGDYFETDKGFKREIVAVYKRAGVTVVEVQQPGGNATYRASDLETKPSCYNANDTIWVVRLDVL